jgi:glycogen synthase
LRCTKMCTLIVPRGAIGMVNSKADVADLADRSTAVPSTSTVRVLLFTNSVTMGGMEAHVALLAQHLDREVFEVFAVCPRWQATERLREMLRTSADHLAVITPDRRWGAWQQFSESLKLYKQLRDWRIDVVHMHSTTYRGQVWALLMSRLAGVRRIFVTEHYAPEMKLPMAERWIRNLFSAAVTGIVCVSEKNYTARRSYVYTPRKRTIVVNNGIDSAHFKPMLPQEVALLRAKLAIPDRAPVVGTAVRFEPEKGLEHFINAMPKICRAAPDVHFLMIGDGSLREELEAQVARLDLSARTHFVGFQNDPRPYMGLMDIFVLPVPVGSMSIALLEAMAMERAVIITFGGAGEAVVHNESGFCAEPCDPDSIADYAILALRDPALRKSLGKAARQRVQDHFSAENVARTLGALYRCEA